MSDERPDATRRRRRDAGATESTPAAPPVAPSGAAVPPPAEAVPPPSPAVSPSWPAVPPPLPAADPRVEPPSPDVVPADEAPRLPGEHRGGFHRLPTAPVDVAVATTGTVPTWTEPQRPGVGIAGWALGFAIVAVVVSWFVGWGFPLGIGAAVAAIVALCRPLESRPIAVWALVLGVLSVLYSAGWLVWAAQTSDLLG